jgi:hypothetical protein
MAGALLSADEKMQVQEMLATYAAMVNEAIPQLP